jgi:DNA helicase HerA-like ATPase
VSIAAASATAQSLDGRTFVFQGVTSFPVVAGDVVVLRATGGERFLGQVLDTNDPFDPDDGGSGTVLAALDERGTPEAKLRRAFKDATLEPAAKQQLELLQGDVGMMEIGSWRSGDIEAGARLNALGFNRHTFLCGQSGSGKTYALGVILERLLLGTALRMVVLDPNADFVRLGVALPGGPPDTASRLSGLGIRVLGANGSGFEPLRLRFATMPRSAQAALLQLDALRDRAEYNLLVHRLDELVSTGPAETVSLLLEGDADERALAQRMENLGLLDWEVWAGDQESAAEIVASGARATVLDLSGFHHPNEPGAVSLDLIESLWAQRESRTPTLIVIDEAHNLCPAEPSGPLQHALVNRLIQVAAEGRKYGLWLLLSTQRPSKLHPQVLSQCDNLAMMRMNSQADVADLAAVFGFAPEAMVRAAPYFVQGEALYAGKFVPLPSFFTMGKRFTVEGGSDVRVPLA